MIYNEYTGNRRWCLSADGFLFESWKPNHFSFGRDTYGGVWRKNYRGGRGYDYNQHMQSAILRAATILALPRSEIRYFFQQALARGISLSIEAGQVHIYGDITLTNRMPVETLRAHLARLKLSGNSGPMDATPPKTKSKAPAAAQPAAPKPATGGLGLVNSVHAPEVARGLPVADVLKYRRWAKSQGQALHGVKMVDAVAKYLAQEARELAGSNAMQLVEAEPVALQHDAHVIDYRKQRANKLRQLRRVAVREGQGRFRAAVLANFTGCVITGTTNQLEAAHIIPDSELQNMHPSNGLALAAWLHRAFDTMQFTINPVTLRVVVAANVRQWLAIHDIQITDGIIWALDRSALAHHYERFLEHHQLQGTE